MYNYLKVFFILATMAVMPSGLFRETKEAVYLCMGLGLLFICWYEKKDTRYIFDNKWITSFGLFIAAMFSYNFIIPFLSNRKAINIVEQSSSGIVSTHWIPSALVDTWWVLMPSLYVIIAILIIYNLVEHTSSITPWLGVIKVMCAMATFIAIYAILQRIGSDQIFPNYIIHEGKAKPEIYKMFTLLGNKMMTCNYIASITPLFLIFKEKRYYVGLAICLLAIILINSAFNLMCAMVGISVVLLLQGKWKPVLACFVLTLIVFIFKGGLNLKQVLSSGFNGRTGMWESAINDWKIKPWTGHGLGNMAKVYATPNIPKGRWDSSHNIIIDILRETGLVGLFIVGGYFCNMFKRIIRVFTEEKENLVLVGFIGCFITWFLVGLSSFPCLIAPIALIGIIAIAGIEVNLSYRRRINL